ncbi:MAG: tyrosine-type recombinase/integrase, partial [Pyrinomonadaceae bacterium]
KYHNLDLVFATRTGLPIRGDNLNARDFKEICKRAGLTPTASLYTLRHTSATLLLLAGENPKVVSERLGHSSIAITLDVYSHVLPTMQQGATAKLEKMLFAAAQ